MFIATKTNVADNVFKVVDDSMVLGSTKENGNKRDYKKEIPLRTSFEQS